MTGRPVFSLPKEETKKSARAQKRGEAETRVIHIAGCTSIFIPLVDGTAEERRRSEGATRAD